MKSRARRSRRDPRVAKYGRRSCGYRRENRERPLGEQTATIGDVVEKESHGGGLPRSSYLRGGWRGGTIINELTNTSEVITNRGMISCSTRPLGRWRGEAPKHPW